MLLFTWVSNAFFPRGSPVDHTWVTSYDSRIRKLKNITQVISQNEHYWYCKGNFHTAGRIPEPIVIATAASPATCLVHPNNKQNNGTIHWYGIDGVCHQVSNQVLYTTSTSAGGKPKNVKSARGYKLSSALYGTYGRRRAEWNDARKMCGVAPKSINHRNGEISLLSQRMAYIQGVPVSDSNIVRLEQARRDLLRELDDIGFASLNINESKQERVDKMNNKINFFLKNAIQSFNNDRDFVSVFGINRNEEIYLIDPELFEFPNPDDRPVRNSVLGW